MDIVQAADLEQTKVYVPSKNAFGNNSDIFPKYDML